MKKYVYILAALSVAPTFALAQGFEGDIDAELDKMYSEASASLPAAQGTPVQSSQPIYILNQAPNAAQIQQGQSQAQIQKQPTTVIEASPLTESRAEAIRRARQDAEVQTEQKIVEKLEQSRMEDEKRRANVLFGDKLNSMNEGQQPVQQQPVYVQPVAPVQQVVEPQENTRDIIREELAAAMTIEEEAVKAPVETKYVAGIIGIGDYPDVSNVVGNYALGVAFGNKYDHFVIEGSFLYSNYSLTPRSGGYYGSGYSYGYPYNNGGYYLPNDIDVNQYTGSLAAKVQLFSGIVKPVVGGVASYSYRTFAWANDNYYGGGLANDTTANSHAIDIGTLAGVDLEFSPEYSLGLDFRYMWNLSSRTNGNNTWMAGPLYSTKIEKLQYYVMSLVGRVNF